MFLEEVAVDPMGTIASVFDFLGVDLLDEKEGVKVSLLYDPRGLHALLERVLFLFFRDHGAIYGPDAFLSVLLLHFLQFRIALHGNP